MIAFRVKRVRERVVWWYIETRLWSARAEDNYYSTSCKMRWGRGHSVKVSNVGGTSLTFSWHLVRDLSRVPDTFPCNTRVLRCYTTAKSWTVYGEACYCWRKRHDEREKTALRRKGSETKARRVDDASSVPYQQQNRSAVTAKTHSRDLSVSRNSSVACVWRRIQIRRPAFLQRSPSESLLSEPRNKIFKPIWNTELCCGATGGVIPEDYWTRFSCDDRQNRRFFIWLEVAASSQTGHSYRHVGKNGVEMFAGRWENEGVGHREPCRLAGLVLYWWVKHSNDGTTKMTDNKQTDFARHNGIMWRFLNENSIPRKIVCPIYLIRFLFKSFDHERLRLISIYHHYFFIIDLIIIWNFNEFLMTFIRELWQHNCFR